MSNGQDSPAPLDPRRVAAAPSVVIGVVALAALGYLLLDIVLLLFLGIVVADNLLMTFIFWELVGFSSYMLIAHYFDKDFAAAASKKAFIVNRIGDAGFLLRFWLAVGSSLPASVNVNGDTVFAVAEEEGDCMVYLGFPCFQ
mgnify:CR=1 FL=1